MERHRVIISLSQADNLMMLKGQRCKDFSIAVIKSKVEYTLGEKTGMRCHSSFAAEQMHLMSRPQQKKVAPGGEKQRSVPLITSFMF